MHRAAVVGELVERNENGVGVPAHLGEVGKVGAAFLDRSNLGEIGPARGAEVARARGRQHGKVKVGIPRCVQFQDANVEPARQVVVHHLGIAETVAGSEDRREEGREFGGRRDDGASLGLNPHGRVDGIDDGAGPDCHHAVGRRATARRVQVVQSRDALKKLDGRHTALLQCLQLRMVIRSTSLFDGPARCAFDDSAYATELLLPGSKRHKEFSKMKTRPSRRTLARTMYAWASTRDAITAERNRAGVSARGGVDL